MTTVAEVFRMEQLNAPPSETNRLVNSDTFIGVEVELEGIRQRDVIIPLWEVHHDGSLRNNGVEYVFMQPLKGAAIVTALQNLESTLITNRESPSLSVRTSVHVHVNVRDLTLHQLQNFLILYVLLEPFLFAEFAPSRRDNHFCIATHDSGEIQNAIGGICSKDAVRFLRNFNERSVSRYGAMNLAALTRFGTVEFRHMGGEWHPEPILDWINTLMSIRDYATQHRRSWFDMFDTISSNGELAFLNEVFPRRMANRLAAHSPNGEMIYAGIRLAQGILLSRNKASIPETVKKMYQPTPPEFRPYNGEWGWEPNNVQQVPAKYLELLPRTQESELGYIWILYKNWNAEENFWDGRARRHPKVINYVSFVAYDRLTKLWKKHPTSEWFIKNRENINWSTGEVINAPKDQAGDNQSPAQEPPPGVAQGPRPEQSLGDLLRSVQRMQELQSSLTRVRVEARSELQGVTPTQEWWSEMEEIAGTRPLATELTESVAPPSFQPPHPEVPEFELVEGDDVHVRIRGQLRTVIDAPSAIAGPLVPTPTIGELGESPLSTLVYRVRLRENRDSPLSNQRVVPRHNNGWTYHRFGLAGIYRRSDGTFWKKARPVLGGRIYFYQVPGSQVADLLRTMNRLRFGATAAPQTGANQAQGEAQPQSQEAQTEEDVFSPAIEQARLRDIENSLLSLYWDVYRRMENNLTELTGVDLGVVRGYRETINERWRQHNQIRIELNRRGILRDTHSFTIPMEHLNAYAQMISLLDRTADQPTS